MPSAGPGEVSREGTQSDKAAPYPDPVEREEENEESPILHVAINKLHPIFSDEELACFREAIDRTQTSQTRTSLIQGHPFVTGAHCVTALLTGDISPKEHGCTLR